MSWLSDLSARVMAELVAVPPTLQLVLVFLFSFAEGLPVVGSILPGGTVAVLAGSLTAQDFFSPVFAAAVIAVGSFLGDLAGFFFGKRYRHTALMRRLIYQDRHQRAWDIFDRHIALITIFGKLIPLVRSTPALFAGARNIRIRSYVLYSATGSILWAVAGIWLGNLIGSFFGTTGIVILVALVVVSIAVASTKFLLRR